MKKWDAFISHASEDKKDVALPLYNYLKGSGLRIWFDKMELSIGDSLREKIDEGLAKSRFGIIIITEKFLQKKWPIRELNGLFAIEEEGNKVILPVWHNIEKSKIIEYSPILADRLAGDTQKGIDALGKELLNVILKPSSGSPSHRNPSQKLIFRRLLNSTSSDIDIKKFLKIHSNIPVAALGIPRDKSNLTWNVEFPGFNVDLIVSEMQPTTQTKKYYLFTFLIMESLFSGDGTPDELLESTIQQYEKLRLWTNKNITDARKIIKDIRSDFESVIIPISRDKLDAAQKEHLKEYNDYIFGISVRTYDWLLESIT